MGEAIYVQNGQHLIRMEPQSYHCEDDFQQLLAKFPDLLLGGQMNPTNPRRWLFISREMAIPAEAGGVDRWSLDHLFLDQDAIPTLVEVKRKSDTRLRREVVGQMMDYAANATVYWSGDILQTRFIETSQHQGQDPDRVLADFLGDGDPERFWQTAHLNLRRGKIRLLFVADRIPIELQRVVEFLNEHMNPTEVLALELRRFSGGELSTHLPRLIGQTTAAQSVKQPGTASNSARKTWDEATFFENAAQHHLEPTHIEVLQKVLDCCKNDCSAKIVWGTGNACGSFNPKFPSISSRSPITVAADGRLDIKLDWLNDTSEAKVFRAIFEQALKDARLPHKCNGNGCSSFDIQDWSQWSDRLLEVLRSTVNTYHTNYR